VTQHTLKVPHSLIYTLVTLKSSSLHTGGSNPALQEHNISQG